MHVTNSLPRTSLPMNQLCLRSLEAAMWIFIVGYLAFFLLSFSLCRAAAVGDRAIASSCATDKLDLAPAELATKLP
jgi:hypothetical protein